MGSVIKKAAALTRSAPAAAVIFDVQRFSLHDGPGIRTTVFFKGCPLRCAWCQNPESRRPGPEMAFFAERCTGCFSCKKACPKGAVVTVANRRILYSKCNACGECARVCPSDALRLTGRRREIDSLMAEVLRDRDFFADSGGGVTLSGGEPMMYPAFVRALLGRLKEESIHTVIETCGMCKWKDMAAIVPLAGMIYFDLKIMDGAAHRDRTGADNRAILENFLKLARARARLQARMPVIPGVNDGRENITATAGFLKRAGKRTIHCLPYHHLGEAKLARIETTQRPMGLPSKSGADLGHVRRLFAKEGIDAIICD